MKVLFLHIIRSIKYGLQNFGRNIFLSIATTSVIVLTLFGVGFFLIINQITSQALTVLQNQIDINLYISDTAAEEKIDEFAQYIRDTENVVEVRVISKEEALELYKQQNENNPELIAVFNFLDTNPLPVTIALKARESRYYNQISQDIKAFSQYGEVVDSSDLDNPRSQGVIDRLNSVISTSRSIGITVIVILAIIAILITYNTIRLTMYSYRSEIEVMRLVGASDIQIKGPFLVEGILFGLFGTIISFFILFIVVLSISSPVNDFINPTNDVAITGSLFDYLVNNLAFIILLKLAVGTTLGVGSGLVAINRYLKI